MTKSAIVFDLEFTAWKNSLRQGWLEPGQFREVVQIGAVRLDAVSLAETGVFNVLAKPRLNPVLSDYFVELTGISNARLAAEGVDFDEAYRGFAAFCGEGMICAFGRDDLVLLENLRLYGLRDQPALPAHRNIVPWLQANGIETAGRHACHVGPLCGAPFVGQEHDALDDARSVAAGIRALVGRGANNPFF